jgi:formylglycine-generating enzyme required for sulfatase activity/serine/threonine protein kinase
MLPFRRCRKGGLPAGERRAAVIALAFVARFCSGVGHCQRWLSKLAPSSTRSSRHRAMTLASSSDPLGIAGTLVAEKYRVERLVGEGGHSVVYKAQQTIWKEPVAIKFYRSLAQAPVGTRDALLADFIQEGRLLATLSSRSAAVVQARDVGTLTTPDGLWLPYMVLEWLEGKSLGEVLDAERAQNLPARQIHEVMAMLESAAVALEVAHAQGVAHRDIKPDNLFVLGDARAVGVMVKVLDFGVAKVMSGPAVASVAETGNTITAFTPRYAAPEQFNRDYGATGPWTDVYALALVMLEVMRQGVPAFAEEDVIALARRSSDPSRRPTPRALGLDVTLAVEAVFARALAVTPSDRYAGAGAFWAALHQAVFPDASVWSLSQGSGGGAAPSAPIQAGPRAAPSSPGGAAPGGPGENVITSAPTMVATMPPRGSRGSTALVAAAAAATMVLAAGGLGAWYYLKSSDSTGVDGKGPATTTTGTGAAAQGSGAAATAAVSAAAVTTADARTACPTGMVMAPGGKFFMGSDDGSFKLWQPAHKVTLDTFCIDITEVTAAAFKSCVDAGKCDRPAAAPDYPKGESITEAEHEKNRAAYSEFCNYGKSGREQHPVNCIRWELAAGYCKAQSKRLPTEAEWEYAARGSDGRKFPWGEDPGGSAYMNAAGSEFVRWEKAHGMKPSNTMYDADDGFAGTAPVGSFPKGRTKFGADDVIGNVWEWTDDWFETYKAEETVNPKGAPAGDRKAIRGGGFNGGVQTWLNPAFRYHQLATASSHGIGFRCAANL